MRPKAILYLIFVIQAGLSFSQFANKPEVLKENGIKAVKVYASHPVDTSKGMYLKEVVDIDSNGLVIRRQRFSPSDSINFYFEDTYQYGINLKRTNYTRIDRRRSQNYDTTFYYQDSTYAVGDKVFFLEKSDGKWAHSQFAVSKKNWLRYKSSYYTAHTDSLKSIHKTFLRPLRKSRRQTNKHYANGKLSTKSTIKLTYNEKKQLVKYKGRSSYQKPKDKNTIVYLKNGLIKKVIISGIEPELGYIYQYIKY